MPLYTYVVSFKGASHVVQSRRSNFRGSGDWSKPLIDGVACGLTPSERNELAQHMYSAAFEPVAAVRDTWKAAVRLSGGVVTVYAVRTAS